MLNGLFLFHLEMAENKKSFILYCDWITTFEKLSDAEAGILVKHLFKYVNDKNPEPPDRITEIAFEPIKQQFKRDLVKWREVGEIRSVSGRMGGIKSGEVRKEKKQIEANEANASKTKQNEANEAVTVNVLVTANEEQKEPAFDFLSEDTELSFKKKQMYDKLINNDQWHQEIYREYDIDFATIKRLLHPFICKKFLGISNMEHISEYKKHFINHLEKVNGVRQLTAAERKKKMEAND